MIISKIKHKLNHLLPYQPARYWSWESQNFYSDLWQHQLFAQHDWLIKQVDQLKPQTTLEVGCGFGRNLKLLEKHIPYLIGLDISHQLVTKAQEHIGKNTNLVLGSAWQLPFKNQAFDLVFTHGLLMHQPPQVLLTCLNELVRVGKQLIIIEETRKTPGLINKHTFAHDYKKQLKQLNLTIENSKYLDKLDIICILTTQISPM